MKPRVLLISTVHPPTDPRIVYKIFPSLKSTYEVFCIIPNSRSESNKDSFISIPFFNRLLKRLFWVHPIVLWHYIRIKPHIVHIFVPELIPLAFLFHWFGATVIYEIQENHHKKFALKQFNNGWLFRITFKYSDRLARQHFHCILTEDAYLIEYNNLKYPSAVIHNYASIPFIDYHKNAAKEGDSSVPAFFYCGVISMERCFGILIEALYKLKSTCGDFSVLLFGPVRFKWKEAQLLPHFEIIRPHLQFFGYTDLKKVLPFGKDALAGIALLKPIGDYPDSYTTKLFEYMALGLPVITSDFHLYKKIVEKHNCGFCIDPGNAEEVAKKLEWLIRNPSEAINLGSEGRKAVEKNYNWEMEEINLLKFYDSLI